MPPDQKRRPRPPARPLARVQRSACGQDRNRREEAEEEEAPPPLSCFNGRS